MLPVLPVTVLPVPVSVPVLPVTVLPVTAGQVLTEKQTTTGRGPRLSGPLYSLDTCHQMSSFVQTGQMLSDVISFTTWTCVIICHQLYSLDMCHKMTSVGISCHQLESRNCPLGS